MIINSAKAIKRYVFFGKHAISLNFRIIFLRRSIYIFWFLIRLRKMAIYPIRKFILFWKGNNLNNIYVRVTDFNFWYKLYYNSKSKLLGLMHRKKSSVHSTRRSALSSCLLFSFVLLECVESHLEDRVCLNVFAYWGTKQTRKTVGLFLWGGFQDRNHLTAMKKVSLTSGSGKRTRG